MKLAKRWTIPAVTLLGVLATTAGPAGAIVGGHDATHPYTGMTFVSVQYPGVGTAQCGGTLITPRIVITAAHCVSDLVAAPEPVAVPAERITVRVGSTDRTSGVQAVAARIVLHPDWHWATLVGVPVSDLALIQLTTPVPGPVMSLNAGTVRAGDRVRIIGWGLSTWPVPAGSPLPTILRQRDVTALPATACAGGLIGAGEICLSAGACFGDSGGPALTSHSGRHSRWRQVGIASRETSDPADPQANPCHGPTIYTDVTYPPFRQWIRDTIRTGHSTPHTPHPAMRPLTKADLDRVNQLKPHLTH